MQQALPALTNALMTASDADSYVASAAFELVAALVEGAPQGGLGDGVFAMLAPALYASLRSTEDRDTIQVRHSPPHLPPLQVKCLLTRPDARRTGSWR